MRQYMSEDLLVRPRIHPDDPGLILDITPESAGWRFLSFQSRRLAAGRDWSSGTGEREMAFVDLGGTVQVRSTRGEWDRIGSRRNVFESPGHVLYLPRYTEFTVTAATDAEFAVAASLTDEDHAPFHLTPDRVAISLRGGDGASRQINDLLPPGSPVHRLILVEVYTPGGNWSSYPPHKHDRHVESDRGEVIEADLEEIYYYRIDRPEGYAIQRVYTDDESPLHRAGFPIDALLRPENDCAVLVPEGHHPVASPPGYTTYYLNALAGSSPSLANRDDPRYTWVKESYRAMDPRLPLY